MLTLEEIEAAILNRTQDNTRKLKSIFLRGKN